MDQLQDLASTVKRLKKQPIPTGSPSISGTSDQDGEYLNRRQSAIPDDLEKQLMDLQVLFCL